MPRMRTLALILLLLSPAALAEECPQFRDDFTAEVHRVIDGDTFIARTNADDGSVTDIRVRLWGINADEPKNWPWGPRATEHLISLVDFDPAIRCIKVDTDRYCRLVAWCGNQGAIFNISLVKRGVAVPAYRFLNEPGSDLLERWAYEIIVARNDARAEKRGIWAD